MKFEILDRRSAFSGRAFSVQQLSVRTPDDQTHVFDLVRHPGAVVLLPVDGAGRLLFVRQFRVGSNSELLELPAGTLNPGEPPEVCAAREIREETGFAARKLEKIGDFYLTPGYSDEFLHIYLASDLYPAPLEGDADEFIQPVAIPVKEALAQARRGEFHDGKTLAALLLALDRLPVE